MMPQVRYFAVTDNGDEVTALGKVVTNEAGLFGYLLHEGEWIELQLILQCLFDPSVGEEIDELGASQLAIRFGGTL